GAQPDRRTVAVASLDDADHARAPDAGFHVIASEGFQLLRYESGGFVHVVEKFWVLVQLSSPCGDFRLGFNGAVQQWHFRMAPRIGRDLKPSGYDVSV